MQIEYSVLSTVIQNRFVDKKTKLLVLRDRFSGRHVVEEYTPQYLRKVFKRADERTLTDFLSKVANSDEVQDGLELTLPYLKMSDKDAEAIFSNGGWDDFYRKYPGSQGIIEISHVGFNSSQTQALACVGIQSHWRNGHGFYFLLDMVKSE